MYNKGEPFRVRFYRPIILRLLDVRHEKRHIISKHRKMLSAVRVWSDRCSYLMAHRMPLLRAADVNEFPTHWKHRLVLLCESSSCSPLEWGEEVKKAAAATAPPPWCHRRNSRKQKDDMGNWSVKLMQISLPKMKYVVLFMTMRFSFFRPRRFGSKSLVH